MSCGLSGKNPPKKPCEHFISVFPLNRNIPKLQPRNPIRTAGWFFEACDMHVVRRGRSWSWLGTLALGGKMAITSPLELFRAFALGIILDSIIRGLF